MPLNSTISEITPSSLPVTLECNAFTYLGITNRPSLPSIVKDNYTAVLAKINSDLTKRSPLHMTLHGRISVIKMNILPRINFLFSMLPLSPPSKFFKDLEAICRNFLWTGKRPLIRLSTLTPPKTLVGLSLPNFMFFPCQKFFLIS